MAYDTVQGATPVAVQVVSENPAGLMVLPSEDGLGVIIQNYLRIHREYFVFRTGYTDADGLTHSYPSADFPAWVQVTGNGFLPAVTGVTSFIGAITDYTIADKTAWAPKTTPTISLPLAPAGATQNTFKVIVVGAGMANSAPQDLQSQPVPAGAVDEALVNMFCLEFFKEFVVPLVSKFLPTKRPGGGGEQARGRDQGVREHGEHASSRAGSTSALTFARATTGRPSVISSRTSSAIRRSARTFSGASRD